MVQSTTTTANPGNIVVPLSAIIDQLQGKMSSADINALLYAIVANKKKEVQPGDLITADLMNQILHDLDDLEMRVAQLEAGSNTTTQPGAVITSINPSTNIHVGDHLTVNGNNFNVPTINNQVSLEQTPITGGFGLGGTSQQFAFDIPDIGVPAGGKTVRLQVSNGAGSPASISFLLLPQVIVPAGRIDVAYSQAPALPVGAPNITAGSSYIFGFTVTPKADRAGNYSVTPTMADWGGAELLEDAVDNVRASNIFPIAGNPSGTDQKVRVRVNVPAAAAPIGPHTLTLNVLETTPGTKVVPGSGSATLAVGLPPPTPETRVQPSLAAPAPGQPRGAATLDGINVRFTRTGTPATAVGGLQLRIAFAEPGTYQLQPSLTNPTGWVVGPIAPLTIPAGGTFPTNQVVNVDVTASANATSTDFIFQISRGTDIQVQYRLGLTVA